ncbi:sensor histidine kinase [Kineococcus sp. SYSU DK004]|uniref:sensor histidine kinase n=1 Tax=Kineococcus sp. SYSU DK004 TaxID=3383125 RepID=UPI003D7D3F5B
MTSPAGPRGRSRWWTSLRGRSSLAFAGLALVLTLAVAVSVWVVVTTYLTGHRERVTVTQALNNAAQLQRGLGAQGLTPTELLAQLPRETGSASLALVDGQWSTTSLSTGSRDVPEGLRRLVVSGASGHQRAEVGGRTQLVVGVPLAAPGTAYFEVFPLQELDEAHRALGIALSVAVLVVPLLALVLGRWVTGPVMRPLDRVAAAAAAVAGGDLDARIDPGGDRHLAPIAASFNATAAHLARRVRADARFASDVAHELRTPLTTVGSAAHVLGSHRAALPPSGRDGLDLLVAEVERLQRLVQDLLEISRADSGTADVVLEPLVLADLVRRSVPAALLPLVHVDAGARDVVVTADRRRLHQVLRALVDNAERHAGGITAITVRTAPGADAGGAGRGLVVVDDAGPGIPPEERERVFERFARGRSAVRGAGGSGGLGLSLVERHLHACCGTVTVEDAPEGGARFVVELPVHADDPPATATAGGEGPA